MQDKDRGTSRQPLGIVRIVLPPLILAAGIGVAVGARLARPAPPRVDTEQLPPAVRVEPVERYMGGVDVDVDGTVVPFRELMISAQVAGRISKRTAACEAGRVVRQGDLLIEIDPRDFELAVERLQAELARAEANLRELDVDQQNNRELITLAREDLKLQTQEVQRLTRLIGDRIVTDSDLDSARRLQVGSQNALQTLENRSRAFAAQRASLEEARKLAAAQLKQAELDLTRTRITSPIDGVVVMEHVEEGAYVQPGAQLVAIEDTSAVEVRTLLRIDQMYWLWSNADELSDTPLDVARTYDLPPISATVKYQAEGSVYEWDGQLSRYDGIGLDPKTRTVPCRVVVEHPQDGRRQDSQGRMRAGRPPALLRGMYVTVALHIDPPGGLLQIPRAALQPGEKVWRVAEQRLEVVPVRVARITEQRVLLHPEPVTLKLGDQLVVTPLATAQDGMEVRAEAATPPAELAETLTTQGTLSHSQAAAENAASQNDRR